MNVKRWSILLIIEEIWIKIPVKDPVIPVKMAIGNKTKTTSLTNASENSEKGELSYTIDENINHSSYYGK